MAKIAGINALGMVGYTALGTNGWQQDMENNLRGLDGLVQAVVVSMSLTAPPVASDGVCYIPAAGATGLWSGKANQFARYNGAAGAWEFWVPKNGWAVYCMADGKRYAWNGIGWNGDFKNAGGGSFGDDLEVYGDINCTATGSFVSVVSSAGYYTDATLRINSSGAGFLTALSISGLTNGKLPRASTAAGLLADSAFGDDGTTASVSRRLTLTGDRALGNQIDIGGTVANQAGAIGFGRVAAGLGAIIGYTSATEANEFIFNNFGTNDSGYFSWWTRRGNVQAERMRLGNDGALTLAGALTLNGAPRPAWISSALATMIGHSSFLYSYEAGSGAGAPTIGRNFYLDGAGVLKAIQTAIATAYPAYLQIAGNGDLTYGTSVSNPTAGATISDMTTKWRVSKEGGCGFFGVAAPTTRPTVNAAATDLATTTALLNQIRTHLIACGLVQ